MSQPALQTHEMQAYLDYEPLGIYWAFSDIYFSHTSDDQSWFQTTANIDGEEWQIRFNNEDCGIAPRPSDDISAETVYEFRLHAEGFGERKIDVNWSPRWDGLETPDGEHIDTPWDHHDREGVEADIQGSNVHPDDYPGLIARFIAEIAAEVDYEWNQPLEPFRGRITEVERYLRLNYDQSKKLTGETGIMQRFMMALAEEQGTQAEYHIDNEGRVGKFHTIQLYPEDLSVIYPQHHAAWGRQLKSYLTRDTEAFEPEDDLYHPKVGALYKKKNSHKTVAWEDRHELLSELDETVLNALEWSNIPTDVGSGAGDGGGNGIFVSDDHFSIEPRLERATIYPDPTPELEAEQGNIIMWALEQIHDTDSDRDITEALATDGGMSRDRLAEKTGWSMSTLYRAIDRLDGAIESRNGHFRFASRELRREFKALLEEMEDYASMKKRQAERWLDVEIRSKSNSAFERFLAKYGGEFKHYDDQDQPVIRIGTVLSTFKSTDSPMLEDVVAQLKSAWRNDGRDLDFIRNARVEADLDNGERFTSVLAAI